MIDALHPVRLPTIGEKAPRDLVRFRGARIGCGGTKFGRRSPCSSSWQINSGPPSQPPGRRLQRQHAGFLTSSLKGETSG